MAYDYGNRVGFLTATTGTGTVNVGSPLSGFQLPAGASIVSGSTVGYTISDGSNWETGTGIYTSGSPPTVSRDTVEDSSIGPGSKITLSGSATVAFVVTAAMLQIAQFTSGSIDNVTIGATTPSTGAFTTISSTGGTVNAALGNVFTGVGRNYIHNPLSNIWQRGIGPFTAIGAIADRWGIYGATDTFSVTQATLSDADRTAIGDEEATFAVQNVFTGDAGAGSYHFMFQKIENIRRLGNKSVTVSFWAKAASGTPKVGVSIDQLFGTGGSPSSQVNGNGTAFTISTTWTRYSATFTLGSLSGKVLGSNGDNSTCVNFWYSSGSTNATRAGSIGQQSGTFSFWGMQLEVGSVMTPLEKPDNAYDAQNCQRFYQVGTWIIASYGLTATGQSAFLPFNVIMRATPTMTLPTPSLTNCTLTSNIAYPYGFYPYVTTTATGGMLASGSWSANADL